ncbi:hypothetical protein M2168_000597 [Streptomyces sp. CZ24]|uniref:DUF6879 family protein n=1 Tax=Streptomyces TaxID=1883 RepID=UPI00101F0665|nr:MULTISPECIES: DUF6879 family protein [unclassified Streptomyces]MBV1953050.1 hypothetical protein [Streptomyces sp. BV333]MDH6187565.1 hypothetical protein [Streptomyces sp. CZ24]RZF04508.1 hypothetical protein C0L86_03085 [Streptomyces sp. SCA2-2]
MSQPKTAPPFAELIAGCERSAVHLETRDVYGVPEEDADFCAFLAGQRCDQADRGSWWNDFHSTIADAVGRGVSVRRMRVVSEPVTDYIRFEYACTPQNIAAGEEVRWLTRRNARGLLLPASDLWIFDDRLVRYSIFSGGGAFVEDLLDDDPATVKSYAEACELIWKRATPHDEFTV